MSNYPDGMTADDYAYLDGSDLPRSWFEDLVNDEGADEINDLWEEFLEACDEDGHYFYCAESARDFMENRYPEYFTGNAA